MKRIFTVPQGTRDILFEECDAIHRTERRLCALFEQNGFREVRTPLVEYYECFAANHRKLDETQMYKFTDHTGRLLVLRPDCTVPIARMAAGRLRDFPKPLRLYYSQSVMRLNRRYTGIYDECNQTGIELLGSAGKRSDLEVLALAAQILESSGEFMLEIGHIGIFERLVDELGVDESTAAQMRVCIEQKNNAALSDLLNGLEDRPAAQWLLRLPVMFGGSEVLESARAMSVFEGIEPILRYLSGLYHDLCELGLEKRILLDLGMVSSVNYYTGIVFRGYLQDMNCEVLSGGRYDHLTGEYGEQMPAIGFAVNVDNLAACGVSGGGIGKTEALVYAENGCEAAALRFRRERCADCVCEFGDFDNVGQAEEYARRKGISRLYVVGETVKTVELSSNGKEASR